MELATIYDLELTFSRQIKHLRFVESLLLVEEKKYKIDVFSKQLESMLELLIEYTQLSDFNC